MIGIRPVQGRLQLTHDPDPILKVYPTANLCKKLLTCGKMQSNLDPINQLVPRKSALAPVRIITRYYAPYHFFWMIRWAPVNEPWWVPRLIRAVHLTYSPVTIVYKWPFGIISVGKKPEPGEVKPHQVFFPRCRNGLHTLNEICILLQLRVNNTLAYVSLSCGAVS